MDHFAEDASSRCRADPTAWGRRFEGRQAVRQGLASRFEGLPDVHYGDAEHFVDGDTGISKWTLDRHHPRGSPARGQGLRLLHVRRTVG